MASGSLKSQLNVNYGDKKEDADNVVDSIKEYLPLGGFFSHGERLE